MAAQGIVFITGSGPGLPELLTVRALELLTDADAVVYGHRSQRKLIPGGVIGGPERFYVGRGRKHGVAPPADVARLLIRLARRGMRVVYLVRGDPFTLGRVSELVTTLHDASVEFEIVPGVASTNVAATYAGIPLLSKTLATATVLASGRPAVEGESATDWSAIAKTGATVVVSNAVAALPAIITGFALAGVPGEIPAAAITRPGTPSQRTVVATLGTISDELVRAGMTRAVTLVIGWTVLLRDELAWFDTRPLFGVRMVFACAHYGSRAVADILRALGALVTEVPQPQVARLDLDVLREEVARLADYDWIVFASPDAVTIFWQQLIAAGLDARALAGARIACIDPATAGELIDHGITVDVVQEKFGAVALADNLAERSDIPGAALLYVADDATAEPYARDLEQAGAVVTAVAVYRDIPAEKARERLRRTLQAHHAAMVVVMSPDAAREYISAAGEHAIGPIPAAAYDAATAMVLSDAGIEVVVEPSEPGAEALVTAIRERLDRSRGTS